MNQDELTRKLNSVGKKVFVSHFNLFQDYANEKVSKSGVIERLVQEGISNDAGAAIRCSNAVLIFRAGCELDALKLIASARVNENTKEIAQTIVDRLEPDAEP